MKIRRADDRGLTDIGWLRSRHTFSFGDYYDPNFLGYHTLRVINDDWVAPGKGFGMHGHRDMEIITLVLTGELEHRDNLGNQQIVRAGEVQVMSAGTGIRHSEYNASREHPAHFLQIWIEPMTKGLTPHYQQYASNISSYRNQWYRIIGPKGSSDCALEIHQNANVYRAMIESGSELTFPGKPQAVGWLHVIAGQAMVNDTNLHPGDGLAYDASRALSLSGVSSETDILLFVLE